MNKDYRTRKVIKKVLEKKNSKRKYVLNPEKWGEFRVGDLFECRNGKGLTNDEILDNPGYIPCVQGGSSNNGSIGLIDRTYCEDKKYVIIDEPCLTVARVGTSGYVNYWNDPCVIGDKCKGFVFKESHNEKCYLFCQAVMQQLSYKYSYGRGLSTEGYLNEIIKLPTTKEGKPNWEWMEGYIKSLNCKPLTTTKKKEDTLKLDPEKWGEFRVGDLFECRNGKGLTSEEILDNSGNIPCVQGGSSNNGSIGLIDRIYCEEKKYVIIDEPCLTVARVGTSGYVNYWEDPCAIGDKCKGLIFKQQHDNSCYLFCQTVMQQLSYKYTYGRGLSTDGYLNEVIKLPITEEGTPDWKWMEDYMKSLPYGDRL